MPPSVARGPIYARPVDRALEARFAGATCVVTGAASGIGRAVAGVLAHAGAVVVLCDIDADKVRDTAEALGASAVVADVTDADAVAALVEATVGEHGRIDFLFNNAGIGAFGPAEEVSLATWRRVVDVDLLGVVNGVAAAYPVMVRQGGGHLVNTASLAGLIPTPLLAPYAAAKHAVVGLSLSLRVEAAAHGIAVTAVCPGPVDTPLLEGPDAAGARRLLTNALGDLYPVDQMADDLLGGVAENRALVVTPSSARVAWEAWRADPDGVLDGLVARALGGRERRAGAGPD